MRKLSKRAILVVSLGLVAIPLGVAAVTAYGCTAVATLSDSPGTGLPGSSVMVTGAFFGTHSASDANSAGAVLIRLGSLTGPVLATATPSGPDRSFSVQVPIPPNAIPGDTFLAATQLTAAGTPVYGTPARQIFTVVAPPSGLFGPVVFKAPVSCKVPNVKGKSKGAAERTLIAAHCGVGTITAPKAKAGSKQRRLVVASSGLSAGTTVASGTKVNLRLRWV